MQHTAWLEDFLALSATGNFSKAADIRHTSQSAFSRRIRSLEEWVGEPLFLRTPQKVIPTEAGEQFQPAVTEALNTLKRGLTKARMAGQREESTLRIAATHAISMIFFPNWLRLFESSITFESVQLLSDTASACEDHLAGGKVHFYLGHELPEYSPQLTSQRFTSTVIGEDTLIPVHAPDLITLSKRRKSSIPLLSYSDQSGLGKILHNSSQFQSIRHTLRSVFSSHLATVLKIMAISGKGVAWLPKNVIETELSNGTLIPFGGDDHQIPTNIRLFRPTSQQSTSIETLWSLASKVEALSQCG